MKRIALALLPLALSACATIPAASASSTAGLNQVASVGDLTIRPLALLEDSRCPASVQCVWAGRVRIRAMITPHRLAVPTGLNTPTTAVAREIDMTLGRPVTEFGHTIVLSEVTPAKTVPGTIDPRAYRFTFATSR